MGHPAKSGLRQVVFTFDSLHDACVGKYALLSWYHRIPPASAGARDWWHHPVRHFIPSESDVRNPWPALTPGQLQDELFRLGWAGRPLLPPAPAGRAVPGQLPQASHLPGQSYPEQMAAPAPPTASPPTPWPAPGQPPRPSAAPVQQQHEASSSSRSSRSRTRHADDTVADVLNDPHWGDYQASGQQSEEGWALRVSNYGQPSNPNATDL